jgi:hypothetical protein
MLKFERVISDGRTQEILRRSGWKWDCKKITKFNLTEFIVPISDDNCGKQMKVAADHLAKVSRCFSDQAVRAASGECNVYGV